MVAVEDPQQPGRDIGASTREMASITAAWAEAAAVLRVPSGEEAPTAAPGRLGLSAVVDVALAVGRGNAAVNKKVNLQRRAGVLLVGGSRWSQHACPQMLSVPSSTCVKCSFVTRHSQQ